LRNDRASIAERTLTLREILAALGDTLWANAGISAMCLAGLTMISVVAERWLGMAGFIPSTVASVVTHYYLTVSAMERLGLRTAGSPNRFWDYWGLLILSGIGTFLGLILLILPGLYISARWAAGGAVLVSGTEQVGDALDTSWKISKPSAWPIVGTLFVIYMSAAVTGTGFAILADFWFSMIPLPIGRIFMSGASIVVCLLGVAVYSLLRPNTTRLVDVFA
jgi:hypothetical protein